MARGPGQTFPHVLSSTCTWTLAGMRHGPVRDRAVRPSASAFRFQRRTALGSHPDHCGYRCEGAPPRAPASLRPRQLVSLPHLRSRRLGRSLPADPEDEAVRDKPQQEIRYRGMSRTGSGHPGPGSRAGAPTGSAAKRRDSSDGSGTGAIRADSRETFFPARVLPPPAPRPGPLGRHRGSVPSAPKTGATSGRNRRVSFSLRNHAVRWRVRSRGGWLSSRRHDSQSFRCCLFP